MVGIVAVGKSVTIRCGNPDFLVLLVELCNKDRQGGISAANTMDSIVERWRVSSRAATRLATISHSCANCSLCADHTI